MYRYDFQVDSASLRLPTLKELVGLTTSLSGQVSSTSEFIQVSSTTNRVVDKTTDINVSRDDDQLNDRGYQKNPTDNDETLPAGRSNNYSDFHDSPLDTKIEREIFDNDILGSEEIQRRSSSAWYDKLRDDEQTRRTFNNEENVAMNEKSLERVELPVKILDHKNGEEIAKLVLLRSPESKLNSAILKPVLRIKIIDHESDKDRETGLQRINDFVKMENSSESSRENELYDNFRSTSAGKRRPIVPSTLVAVEEINDDRNTRKDNPRKRQRIVKARRRTRPIVAKDYSDEKITNVRDDESASFRAQNVRRIAGNGENTIVTLSNTTTIVPEFLDNFSTTVRATTIRGNHSNILKFSNVTRGFYVTKNIDETSSVPDDEVSNSTDFTQSTRKYSSKVENDLLDYSSTQEIDLKTEKMDVTTEKMYFTTEKIDFTTQIDETVVTTSERSYSTADESSIDESTITMSSEISLENTNENVSMEDRQFTTKKLETVTSDYVATVNDIFDQSSGLHVTTTEEKAIHEPAVTTFHPWTSIGLVATTEPTISIESTTSEYTPDDGTEILDKYTVTMVEETTENGLETLKTSENNHWRTSTIMESKSTIVPPVKSVSSRDDKLIESQTKRSKVEIPIKSMSIASDENNTMTTYRTKEIETKNTSVPIKGTFDENNEKYASQTEKSVRRQTNLHGKATTYKVAFNRGGTRYVASSKSISSVGSSLGSRGQSRRTTESFIDNDHYENNVTSEKVLPVTSTSSTESYDRVIKSTVIDESTSSPNSRSSSRVRNNARKTTISFDIDKTGSNTFDQGELPLTRPATTEAYNKTTKKIVSGETTYLTMNLGKGTPSPAENLRSSSRAGYDDVETTRSFETNKTRVNDTTAQEELPATSVSSTESYDKTFEITASGESTYLTTNFVEEASSHSDDSISSSWVHGNALKTTIFFETDDKTESNELDENESSATSSTTTQAYDKTTMSKEVTYTTQNFDESTESDSPNLASSSPRYLVNHESTNNSSVPNESFTMITSTESNDKILEQTTLTSPTNYLTTNFVESTESDDLSSQNFELNVKTIRSYEMTDNTSNDSKIMEELPVTSSKSSEIYEKTIKSTTVRMDYPTTSFIEKNDDRFYPTTMQDQTEAYDQMIDTTNSPNTIMTEETVRSEDNLTESRESNETTASYDKNSLSWLYDRRNNIIDDRKTELPFTSNDATMENVKLESFETTTATYPSTDLLEFIANTDETHTRMNNQTMPAVSGEFIDEITKTMNPSDEKNYVTTEPNDLSITTTLASTIYENMMLTTTSTDANDAEKIHSSVKGYSSSNATFINNARSTTPIYEKHSTIDTSTNFVTPIIELPIKRTRGRVRFTNFAGNNDDANEQNRRTVKQVVVRRRLAKDRHRNVTTAERNFIETEKNLTSEINQNIKNEKIKNKSVNDQNVEIKSIINEKTKIEDVTSDKEKNENVKIVNTKNFRTRTNDRVSEEKINSTKSTRRRVVVYRGRPRSEKIVTTPTTTTSTTTVQSSSLSSDDFTENRTRRRGKWRKRIVLKRSRINAEEDEDQSIAETGDFERALIDDDDDELVGDFRDELGSSYVVIPPEVVKSSNHEDISEEVNLFKNSGAFLRRPGTLVRNEAIGRLRPKSPNTSGPTTLLASKIAPFSRIQSVDPTYEIKTNDQSVRAQELAVTLADPPAIRSTSTTGSGRVGLRKKETTRKISTTIAPRTEEATTARTTPFVRRRQNNRTRNENLRIIETPVRTRRPAIIDYDYYVDDEIRLVLKPELKDKIFVTRKGGIRCLDQGNFAHPTSCKKFITCARMVNGQVIGTEYTCPAKLSFDPVGGICNWSAGLGCEEISKSSN